MDLGVDDAGQSLGNGYRRHVVFQECDGATLLRLNLERTPTDNCPSILLQREDLLHLDFRDSEECEPSAGKLYVA